MPRSSVASILQGISDRRVRCCRIKDSRFAHPTVWANYRRSSFLQAEQPRRIAAENGGLLLVAERRGGEHVVDRVLFPRNRMIGAEHDLAGADLRRQMAQRFGGEYQRVEIELVEIFGRLLLQLDLGIAVLR